MAPNGNGAAPNSPNGSGSSGAGLRIGDTAREAASHSKRQGQSPAKVAAGKIGRNDPCYCGSGKKYKYCHGR